MIELIKRHTEQYTRTPEEAKALLVQEGIFTEDGTLTPEYGGPGWEQYLSSSDSYSYFVGNNL